MPTASKGEAYPGNCEIYIQELDMSLLATGKNPLSGESLGIWRWGFASGNGKDTDNYADVFWAEYKGLDL